MNRAESILPEDRQGKGNGQIYVVYGQSKQNLKRKDVKRKNGITIYPAAN